MRLDHLYNNFFSFFNRSVIYPLYFARKQDNRLHHLEKYKKLQWRNIDQIRERQFLKFSKIFQYAYNNTVFYYELYKKAGVKPEDIRTFEDISKLPVIKKTDIQQFLPKMISKTYPDYRMYSDASGGSTGKPTNFFGDKEALPKKFAAALMFNSWSGWKIGEKTFYLWGVDQEKNYLRSIKESLSQRFVLRNVTMNAFDISEASMRKFSQRLLQEKPSIIIAYANVAAHLANYIKNHKIQDIKLKGIICSAETLTQEKSNLIENVFNCPVFNRYGSREVGLISAECNCKEGMHINAENVLVEFKPLVQNDNKSEVVVTDFHNHAMPIIRYNMQDVAEGLEHVCSCGRGLPLMSTVQGRTSDFIKNNNGNLIHGEYFSHLFYGMRSLKQFQIVQNSLDELNISISSEESLTEDNHIFIKHKIYDVMGKNIRINICEKESIPLAASGKFRFVISNI